MKCFPDIAVFLRALTISSVLLTAGCGGEPSTPPKTDLSEQEKEQIKDLNQQRAQEWGSKKK
jgi:hypothetical protein